MANITVPGDVTPGSPIGSGTGVVIDPDAVARLIFFMNYNEEVLSFFAQEAVITDAAYDVAEDAGALAVTLVRRNQRVGRQVLLNVVTEPVTAQPSVNYLQLASPVTFVADETQIDRNITIINSHMGNGVSKTLRIYIAPPPFPGSYTRGPVSQAVITINGVA